MKATIKWRALVNIGILSLALLLVLPAHSQPRPPAFISPPSVNVHQVPEGAPVGRLMQADRVEVLGIIFLQPGDAKTAWAKVRRTDTSGPLGWVHLSVLTYIEPVSDPEPATEDEPSPQVPNQDTDPAPGESKAPQYFVEGQQKDGLPSFNVGRLPAQAEQADILDMDFRCTKGPQGSMSSCRLHTDVSVEPGRITREGANATVVCDIEVYWLGLSGEAYASVNHGSINFIVPAKKKRVEVVVPFDFKEEARKASVEAQRCYALPSPA